MCLRPTRARAASDLTATLTHRIPPLGKTFYMSVCHLASHCTDAKKVSYPFCYVDNEGTVIGLGLLANRKNTEQGTRLSRAPRLLRASLSRLE